MSSAVQLKLGMISGVSCMSCVLQGWKFLSKGIRRVVGRIRVSYGQRERLSSAFLGTGFGRRVMKPSRSTRHQVRHREL